MPRYADILLPLARPLFTFEIAEGCNVVEGDAVEVQFGKKEARYTGIVWRLHDTPPSGGRAKCIQRTLFDRPIVLPSQRRLWEWIAEYYMTNLGAVMRVAIPSAIKPRALSESAFEQVAPHREKTLKLVEEALTGDIEERLHRRPKQYAMVEFLRKNGGEVVRKEVEFSAAIIRALVEAGVVVKGECSTSSVSRGAEEQTFGEVALPTLTTAQNSALEQIRGEFSKRSVVLLHGVTSSGKTEIYSHLIAQSLDRGEDVLYLVPEISVTSQLVRRLCDSFGGRVVAYHSKLSPSQREAAYLGLLSSRGGRVVVGTRSALFMPFARLGLVVVDEEHDSAHRQTEPSPRYHARDAAIVLASIHGAKTLLGSATPSIESYVNTLSEKYGYVHLGERYGGSPMPQIIISDTLRAVKRGERKGRFNKILLDKIAERLARHEQVMLFQNRTGYSPYVECSECGWTLRCPKCNVSLTLHQSSHSMRCHYCGYTTSIPEICPECGRGKITAKGFGTERVEEEISERFPTARVLRLDSQTCATDAALRRIVSAFERHEADILVGTQIMTKGLDFEDVTLIGILNADNLLNAPDFRASERAWQSIIQTAGRSGRRCNGGEVVVQTTEPTHQIFAFLDEARYSEMAATLLAERKLFAYPPYTRLIRIVLRSANAEHLATTARELDSRLRARFSMRVIGPAAPAVNRVRGEYLLDFILKIEMSSSMSRARNILREEVGEVMKEQSSRGVTVIFDVDFV